MKKILLSVFVLLAVCSGCVQVNLPQSSGKETKQYSLLLPSDFQAPERAVYVREFRTESPAKFKMLSRKGSSLQFDSFAKWITTPTVMISSAYRKLYGSDNEDYKTAPYFLDGTILTFERNLDTNTADLKIQYCLVNRQTDKEVFKKLISSSVPLAGNSPADFASAMSKAVLEQAGTIKKEIDNLKTTE